MSFEQQFKSALEEMIPKEHDDYTELQYSDEIYVQVWSHDNGAGSFEIYAIVPHDSVDDDVPVEANTLSPEVPGSEQFYKDMEQYLEDVTGESFLEIVFYLIEVVDDGAWERDASTYATHELTVDDF